MAMPLEMAMLLTNTVWFALSGWILTCLSIADEIAGSLRNREVVPLHVAFKSCRMSSVRNLFQFDMKKLQPNK
ncbi:unnamed protein product [Arabidopsis halleri]